MQQKFTPVITALIVLTCLTLSSCTKLGSNLKYDFTMQMGSLDIKIPPISDTSASTAMGSVGSTYNVDSFVKANTSGVLGASNISSAKMASCILTLLNPNDSNNFANFQSSNVTFYTNANTTPATVALITNNPNTYAATLNVPADTTLDMKPYLSGNQLTYSLSGKLRKATTDTITCRVQLTMSIHVHG